MPQQFLNNFHSAFLDAVVPSATQVRIVRTQGGQLDISLASGDFYLLTAYRIVNGREVDHEVMRVSDVVATSPGAYTLTVQRAREHVGVGNASAANAFGVGDHIEARWTAGAAAGVLQAEDNLRTLADPAAALENLGAGTIGAQLLRAETEAEARTLIGAGSGSGASQLTGTASPEGVVTAAPGTFYGRTGASAALYYKLSGTGNTGWVLVPTASVIAALAITGAPGASATVGTAYSFVPTISGGTAPYTCALIAGALPAGLSLNTATGAITGTPTTAGTASGLSLRVTDNVGTTATLATFTITVAAAALDSRARFGYGTATAGVGGAAATLFAAMANVAGSTSDRNGQMVSAPGAGQYTWVAVLASAITGSGMATGVRFTEVGSSSTGAFSGALSSGAYTGLDSDPTTEHQVYTHTDSNVWWLFRSNYPNTAFTFNLS